jgi:hypothetical protein
MACSIEISEEYRDKYGLPKEMPEADFYAWLANGGLQALTNDNKLSFDGYKIVDNKFKESLGIAKTISDRVKLTIRKLNQMVYGAEAAGAKTGARSAIETIKELQADARAYLNENKIVSNEAIERAIGRIRNEVTYAKFLTTIEFQQQKLDHFEKVEKVNELLKEIAKLKKSDKLTANNKAFIRNTSFPSAMEVSDLDGYAALLQEYIDKRGKGESVFGSINKKLTEFIEKESAYINSYKSTIASIKETIDDFVLEEEYEALIKEGVFEGTDIQSFEDYKAFWGRVENQLDILDSDEAILEKLTKASKGKKVIDNIKTTLKQNEKELKEAFTLASTESMVLDFSVLKDADLSILSFKELILLSNIIDGILYEGDFSSYDKIRSKLSQAARKKNLYDTIKDVTGKIRRLLDIKERGLAPIPTIISSAAFGVVSEAKLTSFIFGKWNAMISNVEKMHNVAMKEFESKMNALGSRVFESSVAVETFAFINQVDEGITQEEKQEQFKNDSIVFANSAKESYDSNIKSPNPNRDIDVDVKKAKYALEALARFGVIKDLVLTKEGATFVFVEGVTREDIQGKLDPKEQSLYDFLIDSFAKNREDFINGMEVGLGIPFRGIENYFPRFSKGNLKQDESNADINSLLSGFTGVSRTQDRAKKRSTATGKYAIGLREHFSKGLWENMLVAHGQQEINDVVTSIYSNEVGIKSLAKDEVIGEGSVDVIINALTAQVKKELTYGNVSLKSENLISKEIFRLISSMYYGFILNTIPAFIKQFNPAFLTNYILQPATSNLTVKVLRDKELTNKLLNNTTVVRRNFKNLMSMSAKYYPAEYLEGSSRAIVRGARSFPVLGDVLKPIINQVRKKLGKEVSTATLLEYGDTKASNFNIIAGYISYIKKTNKGITEEEIVKKLESFANENDASKIENFEKEAAAAAAETWQQALNSISSQAQQSKVLSNPAVAQSLYLFKSFQVNTHQEFLKNVRRLFFNFTDLTKEERWENRKFIASYVLQQAIFRYTAAVLTQYTLSALAKGFDDDEDKDKIYENEKTLTQFFLGLGTDTFLGSSGIVGDIAIGIASNLYWNAKKEEYVKEIKESNPEFNPKGTAIDPNKPLSIEPSLGGSVYASYKLVTDLVKEFNKEAEILSKAGLPATSALMYPILKMIAFVTASGTLRDASSGLNNIQNKEINKLAIVSGEIKGQYGDFEFTDPKQIKEILSDLKNVKPEDIRRQLVLVEEDGKADLYFVPKEKIEKYKKDAVLDLYGMDSLDYSKIIKNLDFLESIKNAKIDDAAKKAQAVKQIKAKVNAYIKEAVGNTSTGIKKYTLK